MSRHISRLHVRRRKKKARETSYEAQGVIDPLKDLDLDIQSFDIPIIVSIFSDNIGLKWWTKAWFNNSEKGEASQEISRLQAVQFIKDEIEKEAWLRDFYPTQMEIRDNALEQTRQQLLQL